MIRRIKLLAGSSKRVSILAWWLAELVLGTARPRISADEWGSPFCCYYLSTSHSECGHSLYYKKWTKTLRPIVVGNDALQRRTHAGISRRRRGTWRSASSLLLSSDFSMLSSPVSPSNLSLRACDTLARTFSMGSSSHWFVVAFFFRNRPPRWWIAAMTWETIWFRLTLSVAFTAPSIWATTLWKQRLPSWLQIVAFRPDRTSVHVIDTCFFKKDWWSHRKLHCSGFRSRGSFQFIL